jgi:hypothetical protein
MAAKKGSKKNQEGKKKRTAPAALIKVMNVSDPSLKSLVLKSQVVPKLSKVCGLT